MKKILFALPGLLCLLVWAASLLTLVLIQTEVIRGDDADKAQAAFMLGAPLAWIVTLLGSVLLMLLNRQEQWVWTGVWGSVLGLVAVILFWALMLSAFSDLASFG